MGSTLTVSQLGIIIWARFHITLSAEEILEMRRRKQNREKYPDIETVLEISMTGY